MDSADLNDVVRRLFEQGFSRNEIEGRLTEQGYDSMDANKAINLYIQTTAAPENESLVREIEERYRKGEQLQAIVSDLESKGRQLSDVENALMRASIASKGKESNSESLASMPVPLLISRSVQVIVVASTLLLGLLYDKAYLGLTIYSIGAVIGYYVYSLYKLGQSNSAESFSYWQSDYSFSGLNSPWYGLIIFIGLLFLSVFLNSSTSFLVTAAVFGIALSISMLFR